MPPLVMPKIAADSDASDYPSTADNNSGYKDFKICSHSLRNCNHASDIADDDAASKNKRNLDPRSMMKLI